MMIVAFMYSVCVNSALQTKVSNKTYFTVFVDLSSDALFTSALDCFERALLSFDSIDLLLCIRHGHSFVTLSSLCCFWCDATTDAFFSTGRVYYQWLGCTVFFSLSFSCVCLISIRLLTRQGDDCSTLDRSLLEKLQEVSSTGEKYFVLAKVSLDYQAGP